MVHIEPGIDVMVDVVGIHIDIHAVDIAARMVEPDRLLPGPWDQEIRDDLPLTEQHGWREGQAIGIFQCGDRHLWKCQAGGKTAIT
jgi:hypothetical protein